MHQHHRESLVLNLDLGAAMLPFHLFGECMGASTNDACHIAIAHHMLSTGCLLNN